MVVCLREAWYLFGRGDREETCGAEGTVGLVAGV